MGSQIATCAAQHGYDVFVRDVDEQKARRLADSFSPEAGGARGGRMHAVTQPTQLRRCHLVIECAVESLSVKRDLLSEVEPLLGKDALIVTNTSSLPVDQLARSLNIPSRFGGLHFCDPIDRRPLVEIGQGRETSDRTVASLIAFVRSLGKLPLVVRGEIGLVVNRIIGPLLDEGVRLVDAGMAPEVIDEAARRFGYLQGPLEMIDSFGLDTIFSAAQSMMEYRPGTVTPNAVLQRLIEKGRLGRKSGAGFYRWDGATSPQVDPALDQLLKRRLDHRTPPDTDTIVRNLNLAMLDQAIATIDEHVVRDARDVDYCSIHGCGFPVSRGGIMFWAQQVGRQKLTERARQLAHERAGFRLAERLAEADGLT
jgi:3-hydroxyacyl-CoA dehydrogenase